MDPNYKIIDGTLYKKGFSIPFLRCVAHPEIVTIIKEVPEGYDACHERTRSIVQKILN